MPCTKTMIRNHHDGAIIGKDLQRLAQLGIDQLQDGVNSCYVMSWNVSGIQRMGWIGELPIMMAYPVSLGKDYLEDVCIPVLQKVAGRPHALRHKVDCMLYIVQFAAIHGRQVRPEV